MRKLLAIIGLVAAGIIGVSGAAYAAGSDAPLPYTVTAAGVTLTDGQTFPDDGHINWRSNQGGGSVHFESLNNQPSGVYIGKTFYPFNLKPGECVEWVQVSIYNEHFGEGGQAPICEGETTSTPTEPATEPSTPETTTLPTSTPEPSPSPTGTPSTSPTPTTPATSPVGTPTSSMTNPSLSTETALPSGIESPTTAAPDEASQRTLAATGSDGNTAGKLFLAAAIIALLGVVILVSKKEDK